MIVPSAAADTIAQGGGETLKGNACIVIKATDIAQIDEHSVLQTVRFQHIVHLGEIAQGGLSTSTLAQIGSAVQDLGFAKQRGNLQQHMTVVISNGTLCDEGFKSRGILFLQRGLNELALLLAQPSFREDTAIKFELTDCQTKIMQANL